MPDEVRFNKWKMFWNWLYKVITLHPITSYFRELADKSNDQSSHRAVNIVWGLGSFFCYWLDHFIYKRELKADDYMFILAMAGVTTIAAIGAKAVDIKGAKNANQPE